MNVIFCIYGNGFDNYEFLLQVDHFPEQYSIWEDDEIMQNEGTGVTFTFSNYNEFQIIPFSLLRFLLVNKVLLQAEKYAKGVEKEIGIVLNEEFVRIFNENAVFYYQLAPKLMKFLAELNIKICISKELKY